MPLGFHAMETLVIAEVLCVEYRLERGGRVWAGGVTDRDPDRQTDKHWFCFLCQVPRSLGGGVLKEALE